MIKGRNNSINNTKLIIVSLYPNENMFFGAANNYIHPLKRQEMKNIQLFLTRNPKQLIQGFEKMPTNGTAVKINRKAKKKNHPI